ncbi:hypothetical protein GCM10010346_61970 [Streptomyces chryseus]|uniref:Uncharacterized protein n=1 Tax=Streptomyces chryseus TaxID=68186 RepID=A0ABQ3ECX6_9ACTN|nr:hypothetical protein GCM10010346_61970 [Streptomyces chryseus]
MAVESGEFELRLVQYASDGMMGVAVPEGEAELLVLRARTDLVVSAGTDAGRDTDHDLLTAAASPDRSGDPGDLWGIVDDDPAHTEA